MLLALDIGNTNLKSGIFSEGHITFVKTFKIADGEKYLDYIFSEYSGIKNVVICDVSEKFNLLKAQFIKREIQPFFIDEQVNFFFRIKYRTPETLGRDRLAAVAGGIVRFPGTPLLIIDAGTAITFDFVSEQGIFLGGNISPGIDLRLKALNSFTGKLPLLEKKEIFSEIGQSTTDAVLSGVIGGTVKETEGIIATFRQQNSDSKVIFTGGDAKFLHRFIKNDIFVLPNLVLEGLYELFKFNKK